jgi:hypothetical protein
VIKNGLDENLTKSDLLYACPNSIRSLYVSVAMLFCPYF